MAELMDNENAPKVPIDYGKAIKNFMPAEGAEPSPAQEERRPVENALGITATYSPESRPLGAQYVIPSGAELTANLVASGTSLESFGKDTLIQLAESYGIELPKGAKRGEIIDAINERPIQAPVAAQPQETKFSFTTSTERDDAIKKMIDAGDDQGIRDLNRTTILSALADLKNIQVGIEDAKGVYKGDKEVSSIIKVTTTNQQDLNRVRSRIADAAKMFRQMEFLEEKMGAGKRSLFGETDEDGFKHMGRSTLYVEGVTEDQIEEARKQAGIDGLTLADGRIELYDRSDDPEFFNRVTTLDTAIRQAGGVVTSSETGVASVKSYSEDPQRYAGTIGYDDESLHLYSASGEQERLRSPLVQKLMGLMGRPMEAPEGGKRSYFEAKDVTPEQVKKQAGISQRFADLPLNDLANPLVKKAYDRLNAEILKQYDYLTAGNDGTKFTSQSFDVDGEPYANSGEAIDDIRTKNSLKFLKTDPNTFGPEGQDFSYHPLLQDSGRTDANGVRLVYNDLFRAVHDAIAHGLFGAEFGPVGEESAWQTHMRTLDDPWARWALTTETRGQNSYVNYREQMIGEDGMPLRKGDEGYIPLDQRGFAEQKAALLPLEDSLTGDKKVDEVTRKLMKEIGEEKSQGSAGGIAFMPSSKLDEAHAKAIESGNMEEAQRLVDEAIKNYGIERITSAASKAPNGQVFEGVAHFESTNKALSELGAIYPNYSDYEDGFTTSKGRFVTRKQALKIQKKYTETRALSNNELSTEYIKSADPATYDNEGKLIPLSQRFDTSKQEIRFMPASKLDEAHAKAIESGDMEEAQRLVDERAREAFPKTLAIIPPTSSKQDISKQPLKIVYHGTGSDFTEFKSGLPTADDWGLFGNIPTERHAIFFAEEKDFANEFAKARDSKRVIPAYINSENPLVFDDAFDMYDELMDLKDPTDEQKEDRQTYKYIWNLREKWEAFDGESGKEFVDWMRRKGYDSAILSETGYGLEGEPTQDVWAVLEPNQIKSADPATYDDNGKLIPLSQRFDTSKQDIRFMPASPELPKTEDGKIDWEGFKVKTLEIAKPLADLSPLGGVSFMPKRDFTIEQPFDEFGDQIDDEVDSAVRKIAKDRDMGITSDRELSHVAKDKDGNVIGGAYTSISPDSYSFDVVVDKGAENMGVGSALLDEVITPDYSVYEAYPEIKTQVDVINPMMKSMLEKRGFEVTDQIGEQRWIMEPKAESIGKGINFMPAQDIEMKPSDDGRTITYQHDKKTTIKPPVKGIKTLIGEIVGMLEADRHNTLGDNMGGPMHPFLLSNQVIARLLDGRGFKPVWANMNSAFVTRAKNVIKNTTSGRALIQLMKEEAHISNRKFVTDVMSELDKKKASMPKEIVDSLHVILELGARNPATKLKEVTAAQKAFKDGDITQRQLNKVIKENQEAVDKYGPMVEFLAKLGSIKSKATRGNIDSFNKSYNEHIKDYQKQGWYKKIAEKYKDVKFADEAARFTFNQRGAAMKRLRGIAHAPDITKMLADSMDFKGGKNLDLVASVQLSKDPEAFAIYTGKDPKQEAKMSEKEMYLRDQFMKNPKFKKHPSYDWMMLGPENADIFILDKPVDPLVLFPDYAKNHPKANVRNGSKETIVGTMKKSKIPLKIK
jgi:hypothetical protein